MSEAITTKINGELKISEPAGGIRFGTDALLLADFAFDSVKRGRCIDLGTGSGVIPLLMLSAGSRADFVGLELQQEHSRIAAENSKQNGYENRFHIINGSAEDYRIHFKSGEADYIVTNPPYMSADCGKSNESAALAIARREISGGIELFCKAAGWALKSGGSFFAVYRPDRLATLICAMRDNRIEPKRLCAVCPSVGKKPSLILIEGKKDGKEGLIFQPNLYIYTDNTHKTETREIQNIYSRFGERN